MPYVYNRLGLLSASDGDVVISLLAGALLHYSRLCKAATSTERQVVPTDLCLTVPNGTASYIACCILPYLIFLSPTLYRSTSFAATFSSFQTDAFNSPMRSSFAIILYHCERQSTRQDSSEVRNSEGVSRNMRRPGHICTRLPPDIQPKSMKHIALTSRWYLGMFSIHNRTFSISGYIYTWMT